MTTYGTCGVKVWVFKGEIMAHDPMASEKRAELLGGGPGGEQREHRGDRERGDRDRGGRGQRTGH